MNDWKKRLGIVYSTNPDFQYDTGEEEQEATPLPAEQKLYVSLDRKNRKGKKVTLIEGFRGKDDDLKELARMLKSHCGTGGSSGEGEILIQGDFLDRVTDKLTSLGYKVIRKGG